MIFYALSVIVAFVAGGYFERMKSPPPAPSAPTAAEPATAMETPVEQSTPVPSVAPVAETVAKPFTTPALITVPSATPTRIEKAVAVSVPSVASAPPAAPVAKPSPSPEANQVTMTKALEIPVKQAGKIVGYINLQAGQKITPVAVEQDQIKVKTGVNFVYVPVSATDMAH